MNSHITYQCVLTCVLTKNVVIIYTYLTIHMYYSLRKLISLYFDFFNI